MWLGQLSLSGVDPRAWDLGQMLAAFEVTMRQGSKDETDWRRQDAAMKAEPKEVRDERRRAEQRAAQTGAQAPSRVGMSVDEAESLIARFAATDALYGG